MNLDNSSKTHLYTIGQMLKTLLSNCVHEGTPLTKSGIRTYLGSYMSTSSENVFKLKSMLFSFPYVKHVNGIGEIIAINKTGSMTLLKYSRISSYPNKSPEATVIDFDNVIKNSSIMDSNLDLFNTLQAIIYFAIYSGDRDLLQLISYIYLLFSKEV